MQSGDYLFFGHFDSGENEHVITRQKVAAIQDDGMLLLESGVNLWIRANFDYTLEGALADAKRDSDDYYNNMIASCEDGLAKLINQLNRLKKQKLQITRMAKV
jgi:hypothetical protein